MADVDVSMEDANPQDAFDDEEVDFAAHERLLKSIYALDGKKRFQNEVRGAPAPSGNLDLVVHNKEERTKILPEELDIKHRKPTQVLNKPMSELDTERAKRCVAQEAVMETMGKWDPIMQEIRAAPQIKYADRPKGLQMYEAMKPMKFTPRTSLEMEIFEALGRSEDNIHPDRELTQAEENALKAMSIEEAKERRQELMKHHELLFRMQVKAKRVKKIKSKSFRRFLRKDKVTAEKKMLEDLQKNDPEAFLERMEQLETARMEERLTLKHRGGGKFARTHKAYSKFDPKTREAVQEMLQKSRELTKKRQDAESSEDESDEDIAAVDTQMMRSVDDDDDGEEEETRDSSKPQNLGSKHLEILKAVTKKAGGWLAGPTAFVYADNERQTSDQSHGKREHDTGDVEIGNADEDKHSDIKSPPVKKRKSVPDTDTFDIDDDDEAETLRTSQKADREVEEDQDTEMSLGRHSSDHKKKTKRGKISSPSVKTEGGVGDKSSDKKPSKRKLGEEDSMQVDEAEVEDAESSEKSAKKKRKKNKTNKESTAVTTSSKTKQNEKEKPVPTITLKSSAQEDADVMEEREEEDEERGMRVTMEELFQDEDVVEQFAKDKLELEEKKRPKVKDTRLPGWGHWSGPDYKAKPAAPPKRRKIFTQPKKPSDGKEAMPNVWLNPNRNGAIRKFQPKAVPFPYTSVDQYEASLRHPVSRGFVRETAHKALNKPEVVTKQGHIIKPLDKEDFFNKKKKLQADDQFGKPSAKGVQEEYAGPIKFKNARRTVR